MKGNHQQKEQAASGIKAKPETMKEYKKYYIMPASPEEVYEALTHATVLETWTGETAEMSTEPGSEFSLWEGSISGKNLEFETNRKIVQQWYFGDQEEPSVVTIKLHPHKQGTSVELRHTNIPDEAYDDMTEGWDETYFGSLEGFLEQ
ncbi:MAG TPA: SRPBCC domain-containing protein [Adhaeribacter sp.]|nr:SRPBCC domain-containing protein [Adhaeribacter sp.]